MEKTFDICLVAEVWVIHRNHIVKGTVSKVWYTKFIDPVDLEAVVESEWDFVCDADGKRIDSFRKKDLFLKKEDLISSLWENS